MIHTGNYKQIKPKEMESEDVRGVKKRVLIGKTQNAPHFIMRMFSIEKGGHSPYHQHSHEHEVFILKGKGIVKDKEGSREVKEGDFVYVPPNCEHQFLNPRGDCFEFLCLIPA